MVRKQWTNSHAVEVKLIIPIYFILLSRKRLCLVAGSHVDMALGGDQGGSIRMPAAACGVVGLKPTYGLVPYTGIMPMEFTLDHTGQMATTVHDAALTLEVRQ